MTKVKKVKPTISPKKIKGLIGKVKAPNHDDYIATELNKIADEFCKKIILDAIIYMKYCDRVTLKPEDIFESFRFNKIVTD